MIRRALIFALIAVFAIALAGGCSLTAEENIECIVKDYYGAYNAADWDACLVHIYDANNLGTAAIRSALVESRAATGMVTVENVENIAVSGPSATADVTLTWDADTHTQEWTFVKKDSGWKISYPTG